MKLTRRGRIVVALLIIAAFAARYYVSTHVWWTGDGYCLGSVEECLVKGLDK